MAEVNGDVPHLTPPRTSTAHLFVAVGLGRG